MAATNYQRTVADMRKAGINPILAANMGLGADSVSSGATASMSSPSTYMASSYADTNSSSNAYSNGSSWSQQESGLATGLQLMGEALGKAIGAMNSGSTINYVMSTLGDNAKTTWNDIKGLMIENLPTSISNMLGLTYDATPKQKGNAPQRKKTITGKGTVGIKGSGTHTGGGRNF